MVGIVTDFTDASRILSLHFTRLALDGRGKALLPKERQRSFLSGYAIKGGVIWLCDDSDVSMRLGVGEGIESTLAVATSLRAGTDGYEEPLVAALSAGNLASLPVLRPVEVLVIYADRGKAGEEAAERLAQRWLDDRREVLIAVAPVDDWNTAP
jgi:hypothetical protein